MTAWAFPILGLGLEHIGRDQVSNLVLFSGEQWLIAFQTYRKWPEVTVKFQRLDHLPQLLLDIIVPDHDQLELVAVGHTPS